MTYCRTRALSKIFCVSASCLLLPFTLYWLVRFSTFIDLNFFKLFLWVVSKMDCCFVINLSLLNILYSELQLISNSRRFRVFLLKYSLVLGYCEVLLVHHCLYLWKQLLDSHVHLCTSLFLISADRVAGILNTWFTKNFCTWCYNTTDFTLKVNDSQNRGELSPIEQQTIFFLYCQ